MLVLGSAEKPGWSFADPNVAVIALRRSGEQSCGDDFSAEPGSHITPCTSQRLAVPLKILAGVSFSQMLPVGEAI